MYAAVTRIHRLRRSIIVSFTLHYLINRSFPTLFTPRLARVKSWVVNSLYILCVKRQAIKAGHELNTERQKQYVLFILQKLFLC